ncbi:MAG: hypothetical protein Tsb006_7310 [Rickettsiaceae bacterium]
MHAVILAGGVGSRLWPVSTQKQPKPFIRLEDNMSLLQKSFMRASAIKEIINIVTVTNVDFVSKVIDHYNELVLDDSAELCGRSKERSLDGSCMSDKQQRHTQAKSTDYSSLKRASDLELIVEPFARDTAAAITAAAIHIEELYGPDEVILVLPSDHIISDQDAFSKAVAKAGKIAKNGKVVTFGIKPSHAEVGYGYIKFRGSKVTKFIEKPTLESAKKLLEAKDVLWNSGILCFTARTFINEMEKHCREDLGKVTQSMHSSVQVKQAGYRKILLNPAFWQSIKPISIDYALMEKSDQVSVVPCSIDWHDVGNWDSMSKLGLKDINGNNVKGNALIHNVSDCYIESSGSIIAAVGVKNLAIIETKNGFLVVDKKNAASVKEIFSLLKEKEILAKIS